MKNLGAAVVTVAVLVGPAAATAPAAQNLTRSYGRVAAVHPAATVLVTPSGGLVGGKWQRWVDQQFAPSYRGAMTVHVGNADVKAHCVAAASACTFSGSSEIVIPTGSAWGQWGLRDTLYYEEAHVIDFRETTNADRAAFMRLWRMPGTVASWWTGEAGVGVANVHVPGEWFAEGYRLCAENRRWTYVSALEEPYYDQGYPAQLAGIGVGRTMAISRWALRAQRETCALFRGIDARYQISA